MGVSETKGDLTSGGSVKIRILLFGVLHRGPPVSETPLKTLNPKPQAILAQLERILRSSRRLQDAIKANSLKDKVLTMEETGGSKEPTLFWGSL